MKYVYVGLLFLIISCIDPIVLTVPFDQVPTPVIDANLSSARSSIFLSWSTGFSNEKNTPITNAKIIIWDEQTSDTLIFSESTDGKYNIFQIPADGYFKAGHSYLLRIELEDGRIIQSKEQLYLGNVNNKSRPGHRVINRTRVRPYDDKIITEPNIEVIMETEPEINEDERLFFRYSVTPRWLIIPPKGDGYCTVSDFPLSLLSIGEQKLEASTISIAYMPIDFKMDNGIEFYIDEYSMNRNAYNYWKAVKEQIDYQGTAFETPPVNAKSNLYFLNQDEETEVLGFFSVESRTRYQYNITKDRIPKHTTLRDLCRFENLEDICVNCTSWRERRLSLQKYKTLAEIRWLE